MRASTFFKGLSWLLVLNLLIKPAWIFLIDRQVQNIVGPEAYGNYFALFNLTYVLSVVADAGLTNMLVQRQSAGEDLSVRQLLTLKLLLIMLYAAVCLGVGFSAGIQQWEVLSLLIGVQSLNSLLLFYRGQLAARQLFKTDALFSVIDKTLLLLLCLAPVYGFLFRITILRFLQLQVLSTTIAVICLAAVLLKKQVFAPGKNLHLKTIASWVLPFVLIILLMSAHNRVDAFLLERIHPDGARQAGTYAMAYRLLDAANMVGFLTASFLVPFLSRNQHNKAVVEQVLITTRHGLLLLAAAVVGFVLVFAPWLQALLYHSSLSEITTVIQLCLAVLPAYYLVHVYGSVLTATAQFRLLIRVLLTAVVVNVSLNLWLIPAYGAVGCCIAALASQYFCAFLLWILASKKLALSAGVRSFFLYPAAAIVCGAFFYLGQKLTLPVWIILSSIALLVLILTITQRNLFKKLFLVITDAHA